MTLPVDRRPWGGSLSPLRGQSIYNASSMLKRKNQSRHKSRSKSSVAENGKCVSWPKSKT
jgi:hypothetical protein